MKYLMTAKAGYSGLITLTSPVVDIDGVFYKILLDKMLKWLLSSVELDTGQEGVSLVWVLEFQERGAPHVHILVNGWIGKDRLARKWGALLLDAYGNDPDRDFDLADLLEIEENAVKAGTRIERIQYKGAMRAYMGKYAAKHEQKDVPPAYTGVGRFWGVRGFKEKVDATTYDLVVRVPDIGTLSHISHVLGTKLAQAFSYGDKPCGKVRPWKEGAGVHVYRKCEEAEWSFIWEDLLNVLAGMALETKEGGGQWQEQARNISLSR